jgi:hypothetical protein
MLLLTFLLSLPALRKAQNSKPDIKHPEGKYVLINSSKIWYEIEVNGEAVLLIPGGTGNSHTYFHPWFSDLAKNYKVIYFTPSEEVNCREQKIQRNTLSAEMLKMLNCYERHSDLKNG